MFVDSDGDFLPDALEWVLGTDANQADSNGDDISDFIEAVQHRMPGQPALPTDSEARVLVTVVPEGGENSVWMHLICRMPSGEFGELTDLEPYFDWKGIRVPTGFLVGLGRAEMRVHVSEEHGLLLRVSVEMSNERALRRLLPCAIGADIRIGGREISSATYLLDAAGHSAAWVPTSVNEGFVQTLVLSNYGDPFWSASRVCVLGLQILGTAPGGTMCVVDRADCIPDGKLACPPTCVTSKGTMMFFPDGLSTVVGGSAADF